MSHLINFNKLKLRNFKKLNKQKKGISPSSKNTNLPSLYLETVNLLSFQ